MHVSIEHSAYCTKGFPGGAALRNHLPVRETQAGSLAQEDPPGGGNDNPLQYSYLGNSMHEDPGGLQSMGSQESDRTEQLSMPTRYHTSINALHIVFLFLWCLTSYKKFYIKNHIIFF